MGLLMLLGLVVIYAIGTLRANALNQASGAGAFSDTYFVLKQAMSLALAVAAFAAFAILPFVFARRYADAVLIVGLGLSALLFMAGLLDAPFVQCTNGACRWFDFGALGGLQPAELLKFGTLLYAAGFLSRRSEQGLINDFGRTILPLLLVLAAGMLCTVVLQKDMGTGLTLVSLVAVMLMVAGISWQWGVRLLVALLVVGAGLTLTAPHRMERLATFLEGDSASVTTADAESYHITQAKIAIGTGGLLGVGIGNSIQATGYLPESINDSVFAIMGETFGFVGLVAIIALFCGLLMRLLKVSDRSSDTWMKLVAAGVFGWLGSHIILNIASMIGIFPLTGITLPLLSFGGTSMVFMAAALGLVFQISRYTSYSNDKKEVQYAYSGSGRGLGRTRDARRRRSA